MKQICIVGTDTEIGKTFVCCNLLNYLSGELRLTTAALKPIASGVMNINGQLCNEDAYKLYQSINCGFSLNQVNPICFSEPIAPHIAAQNEGYPLTVDHIVTQITPVINAKINYDYMLIEGVGGVLTPLNHSQTYLDLLKKLGYPIILVVGVKLGCLNHALLTYQCLRANRLEILGWVANIIQPDMPYWEENINYLSNILPKPLLAINPYNKSLQPNKSLTNIFIK